MFLAIKEIIHDKLRYSLIIVMVVLIAYLLFMLTGLMNGLARENTAAITSWQTRTVLLNQNANDNMSQSLITANQLPRKINNHHMALIGQLPVVMKAETGKASRQTVQLIGLQHNQFIYQKRLNMVSGHRPRSNHQLVLDQSMRTKGFHLGTKVRLNAADKNFKIVGFAKNAKFNIAPVVYGSLWTWQQLRGKHFVASAVISDQVLAGNPGHGLKKYSVDEFINKLPGYTAQNSTFELMIAFLLIISLVVIAVFLYIITMQKKKQYAVLRAQGIPSKTLVWSVIAQSLILMASGVVIAVLLTLLTARLLPVTVPLSIEPPIVTLMAVAIIVLGMAGSILPVAVISRIDPLTALK